MTDFSTIRRIALELPGPESGTLEARASIAFKILALLGYGGVVLAMFPGSTPVATLLTAAFNIAAFLLASVLLIVALGLDRRRPWAVAAVRPLLILLIIAGLVTIAIAWSELRIRVPVDVVLAGWALLGPADEKPIARQEPKSAATAVGVALLLGSMLASPQLFSWGGVFDVHEPDLHATLAADCGTAGAGLLPDRVTLRYEWSWTASSVMPSGTDIVVLGWTAADSAGRPLYVIDQIPPSTAGVYSGLNGYPSTQMADSIARESQGAFRWAMPLAEQQFASGRIELHLRRSEAAAVEAQPQPLTVTATYVHLGLWRQSPATVTCSW
ncbi:MAG: hypothetical protein ABI620_06010 [Chloroflexota bacterium]